MNFKHTKLVKCEISSNIIIFACNLKPTDEQYWWPDPVTVHKVQSSKFLFNYAHLAYRRFRHLCTDIYTKILNLCMNYVQSTC